jgi:ketosteroid isomerase-like protein
MSPATEDHRDPVLRVRSRDKIEVVRDHIEAYVRRDLAAMRRVSSADLELDWSASRGWLADVYRGIEEVMRFYADYYAHFEEIVIETESYMSSGDYVVVPNIAYQRGRGGVEVTARSTFVFTVCDGRITRICLYQETPEALKAVGLADRPHDAGAHERVGPLDRTPVATLSRSSARGRGLASRS